MIDAKTAVESIILNIANIVIMFLIVRFLVYKPVKKFLTARRERVEADIAEADEKQKRADDALAEAEAARVSAEEFAQAEKTRILDAASADADRIVAEANAQANVIRDEAVAEAAHSSDRIMDDMREHIADIAVDLAGEIIGREIDKNGSRELIDGFFDKVSEK